MSKVWLRNSDLKAIRNSDGKILICDNCPCGGCHGFATSFSCSHTRSFNTAGTSTGTLTLGAIGSPDCYTSYGIPANIVDTACLWFGTLDHPTGNDERCFLYPAAPRGAPAEWVVNWGFIFNPATCSGQQAVWTKTAQNLWTTDDPVGTYAGGSPGTDFLILS